MSTPEEPENPSVALKAVLGGAGALGCLAMPVILVAGAIVVIVFGGFGVLLGPVIALKQAFDPQQVATSVRSDGTGPLNTAAVPNDLVQPIQQAGGLCGVITPVVIAAQLQQASGLDANKTSATGAQGIAQLPPATFDQFAQDDAGDGKISPFNATDSILALGRFDCSLAGQVANLAQPGQSSLDLTLAAVIAGVDAVRQARGVPAANDVQAYVAAVRAQFPKFDGTLPAPSTTGAPPTTAPSN